MPWTHTSEAAVDDMFLLAWDLYARGWSTERSGDQLPSCSMYASTDIRSKGMLDLEVRVDQFNADHVRCFVIGTALTASATEDTDFVNIDDIHMHDYATIVHEGHDVLDNPTIEIAPVLPGQSQKIELMDLT